MLDWKLLELQSLRSSVPNGVPNLWSWMTSPGGGQITNNQSHNNTIRTVKSNVAFTVLFHGHADTVNRPKDPGFNQ